jgi:integrase
MPTITQRGRSWYLNWSGPDRDAAGHPREHRESLGPVTRAFAEGALRLKRAELARARLSNVVQLPPGGVPTLAEFAVDYLAWHRAEYPASHERVRGIVERHLVPAMGTTALDRLTKTQAERYKGMRDGVKPTTVGKELRTLQAVLNRAVFLDLLARNPIAGVRPPPVLDSRPQAWFTADELARLYAHARPHAGDEAAKGLPPRAGVPDYAPVWRLMANTGLRRAEALQLMWLEVGATELRIVSTAEARTKSRRWRLVPLSAGALAALEALRTVTGARPHVLPRVHAASLSRTFRVHARRAGLPSTSIHSLRHTFCAHLVQAGVPLRTVQVLAGHASYSTTERYAHLAPGYLSDAIGRLTL